MILDRCSSRTARERAAECKAEAAAALEKMRIAEEAMTALAGLPDAGAWSSPNINMNQPVNH